MNPPGMAPDLFLTTQSTGLAPEQKTVSKFPPPGLSLPHPSPLRLIPPPSLQAKRLPDAPATRLALDTKCRPVKLRIAWQQAVRGSIWAKHTLPHFLRLDCTSSLVWLLTPPPLPPSVDPHQVPPREQPGFTGPWLMDSPDPGSCSREIAFGSSDVILAGDHSVEDLIRFGREGRISAAEDQCHRGIHEGDF